MTYLISAVENFIAKLEEIHNSPDYQAVWQNYVIHGGIYKGPTYTKELQELKDTLTYEIAERDT